VFNRNIFLFISGVILVALVGLIGCGAQISRVNVVGSTSVQPIAELLAEKFMEDHRDITINVQGGGSSAGIKAAVDGTAEIGTSSRQLNSTELQGLKTVEIALDGIAIINSPQNSVKSLTMEQLKKIFSGGITNWSQVGGSNKSIVVVNREEGSGTRGAFTELVMGDAKLTLKAIVQGSTGAVRQTVSGNPDAIGYISLAASDKSVQNMAINGISCTVANIKQKKYPIVRPFLFVLKGQPSPATQKFIDYILKDGQAIIVDNGLISIQ
jgi:phosphate transport system substrate-binding protein